MSPEEKKSFEQYIMMELSKNEWNLINILEFVSLKNEKFKLYADLKVFDLFKFWIKGSKNLNLGIFLTINSWKVQNHSNLYFMELIKHSNRSKNSEKLTPPNMCSTSVIL